MSIANELQAARTTFETLVSDLEPKGAGLAAMFAEERRGSGSSAVEFDTAGAAPQWAQWTDEKDFDGIREMSVTCPFARYHKSLKLKRAQVVYDQAGTVGSVMRQFMGQNDYLYDKLVLDKLTSNPTGIDGVSIVNDSHSFGADGGTWDNKVTGALSHQTFKTGIAFGLSLQNEKGEYMEVRYDTLLVHPDEERLALEIADADSRPVAVATTGLYTPTSGSAGASSIANVFRGRVNVVVTPRMTSGDWLLVDTQRFKPIGLAVWRDPESIIADDLEGESRMRRDDFLYSVEADVNTCGLQPWGVYGKLT